MLKIYCCRVRVGDCEYESEISCDIKAVYKIACSLARYGKRHQIKTRFVVRDTLGNTVIRIYSRYSVTKGTWIARHSSCCRYSGYHGRGRDL